LGTLSHRYWTVGNTVTQILNSWEHCQTDTEQLGTLSHRYWTIGNTVTQVINSSCTCFRQILNSRGFVKSGQELGKFCYINCAVLRNTSTSAEQLRILLIQRSWTYVKEYCLGKYKKIQACWTLKDFHRCTDTSTVFFIIKQVCYGG
jgi:hypothetical protein